MAETERERETDGESEAGGERETRGEGKLPSAGLTEVGQIAVTVQDVERATAFYRERTGRSVPIRRAGARFFRPRWSTADAESAGRRRAICVAALL